MHFQILVIYFISTGAGIVGAYMGTTLDGKMESETCICLLCYLAGNHAGIFILQVLIFIDYFKKFLDNQAIKIGEEIKNYNCYCKLVKVNENMRLY